jgi:hypothetical protein
MVELVATVIITVSSIALFGYWLRCLLRLIRFNSPLPKAAEDVQNEPQVFEFR